MSVYGVAQRLVRALWPLVGRLDVTGLEHIPGDGPFLLISNHQSYLDPVLVQAVVRRPMYTMAKSTEFSNPVIGPLLKRLKSFPVRRFEIDPQAVRIVLKHLRRGDGVGIYIEGERTWDGRLQPPRLGTIRLVLKAGVPVIPCGISGAYDVWPRWSRLRRGRVRIRFGEPLRFPQLDRRADREAALDETREALMSAIAALAGVGRADRES
ncbi:MAG: lysophospholipid acyltransferase family protein [Gemmatimonadota bacterium]